MSICDNDDKLENYPLFNVPKSIALNSIDEWKSKEIDVRFPVSRMLVTVKWC